MSKTVFQLLRFGVVGGVTVGVDALIYLLCGWVMPLSVAKGISFIAGASFGFTANKLWTFENDSSSFVVVLPFVAVYMSSFCVNVSVHAVMYEVCAQSSLSAFLGATGVSCVMNFFGMKLWVFKDEVISSDPVL